MLGATQHQAVQRSAHTAAVTSLTIRIQGERKVHTCALSLHRRSGCTKLSGCGCDPVSLGAVLHGTSRGRYVDLVPGAGEFTVWTEVRGVREGGGQYIGLMVGTTENRECGDVHTSTRIIG